MRSRKWGRKATYTGAREMWQPWGTRYVSQNHPPPITSCGLHIGLWRTWERQLGEAIPCPHSLPRLWSASALPMRHLRPTLRDQEERHMRYSHKSVSQATKHSRAPVGRGKYLQYHQLLGPISWHFFPDYQRIHSLDSSACPSLPPRLDYVVLSFGCHRDISSIYFLLS